MKNKLTFFQQTSVITSILVSIFFLVNWIGYAVDGVSFQNWIVLENLWALPAFGIILLSVVPFERKWTKYFQAVLFFVYGFVMILGKGINYDCIPLFFVGSLLLRKYGFFLKQPFAKLPCLIGFITGISYFGHFASGQGPSMGWEDVHRCVALIIATTTLACVLFRHDILTYQNEKKKRENERLRKAGEIITTITGKLYGLLSSEPEKSKNLTNAIEMIRMVKVYSDSQDKVKVQSRIKDYLDFALYFAGDTNIIKNYEDIPEVGIYRHSFLVAIVNLIMRSTKAMRSRVHKVLEVSILNQEAAISILIHDCGVGMSKTEKKTLWESDGMIQVSECINKHKWNITVESLPSLYTEFIIEIPLN